MTEVRRSKRIAGSEPAAPVKDAPAKRTKKETAPPAKKGAKAPTAAAKNAEKAVDAPASDAEDKHESNEEAPAVDADTTTAAIVEDDATEEDAAPAAPKVLKLGDVVPNVELLNESDEVVHVLDLVKEKGAVFFMFPKADTPGCTKQACGFRDEYEKFKSAGYNVFALSGDSPKALSKWKAKKELPYKLLSDPKHVLIAAFGSSKPGKKVQRSHVIVAAGGAVVDIQAQVSPLDSVDKSVAFVSKP
ncbi:hypothetical protein H257_14139 [Aphanomyces astaci]|uniref:thioredoxin-dependent peroxiredoxin n=1 Tax=Aphanomyces astaci TaxID=112090 RepID=W4FUJ2_APHAT|nr:hypothetical protein H257_14139 [Aphanomyces astaci]ETV70484.1 hypothetical protein H257_14139 [Aphanomyces astaci]RQM27660.1 hypothetical protein B5M09_000504 [Aphanomyces astaci]|eukprot:XP_009840196.1 hypothetical protein H257_14139 [Aphanomyces astaci]